MQVVSAGSSVHKRPMQIDHLKGWRFHVVRLQTDGRCHVLLNGITYLQRPGDLLLCRTGDSYQLTISGEHGATCPSTDYYLITHLEDDWYLDWWNRNQVITLNIGIDQRLMALWKQIAFERRRVDGGCSLLLDYLVRSFLLYLERMIVGKDVGKSEGKNGELMAADKMKEYIELNATQKPSLRQICSSAGLSVSRASEIFKKTFNQSIIDYAIEVRLSIAKERMVIGGSTLEEISFLCGFQTYPYFNRAFRARYGLSPSEYIRDFQSPM
jgi:AraC family transcriptional regulator of arabinose operon